MSALIVSALIVSALIVSALGGCAQSGREQTAAAAADLSRSASIYVAMPADGRFANHVYPGSGARVARLVAAALQPHVRAVETAGEVQTPAAALASARAGGFTYLALPRILRWEDRAGVWSGMPDAAKVQLALIECRSGNAAEIAVISGDDRTMGEDVALGDRPADLLVRPLAVHTKSLFAAAEAGPAQAAR